VPKSAKLQSFAAEKAEHRSMGTNTDKDGSSDQDIGRPGVWREGRYQQPGGEVDESVTKEPQALPKKPVSNPVSEKDYEQ
jgi:hypothetical protein